MKTMRWVLIGCRVLTIAFGLTLLNSGCGEENTATTPNQSAEEKQRDADTRKAMEAASETAKKK